jgi:hypothetical protein
MAPAFPLILLLNAEILEGLERIAPDLGAAAAGIESMFIYRMESISVYSGKSNVATKYASRSAFWWISESCLVVSRKVLRNLLS